MTQVGRILGGVVALLGLGLMWQAKSLVEESELTVSYYKTHVEVAHWIETGLYIDGPLMLIGSLIVFAIGVLWLVITPRTKRDLLSSASLVLASVVGFFFAWGAFNHVNLKRLLLLRH
jgi:hypothetical protein